MPVLVQLWNDHPGIQRSSPAMSPLKGSTCLYSGKASDSRDDHGIVEPMALVESPQQPSIHDATCNGAVVALSTMHEASLGGPTSKWKIMSKVLENQDSPHQCITLISCTVGSIISLAFGHSKTCSPSTLLLYLWVTDAWSESFANLQSYYESMHLQLNHHQMEIIIRSLNRMNQAYLNMVLDTWIKHTIWMYTNGNQPPKH